MAELYNDYTPDDFDDLPSKDQRGLTRMKIENDQLVIVTREYRESVQKAPLEQALVDLRNQKKSLESQVQVIADKISELESMIEANRRK